MESCFATLKKEGKLIIWWADVPKRDMINPRRLRNFKLFKPVALVGYPSGYRTKKNVVIEFLTK